MTRESQAVGYDGRAMQEWIAARDIDYDEIISVIRESAPESQLLMVSPEALIAHGFRWGYEVAITRERQAMFGDGT